MHEFQLMKSYKNLRDKVFSPLMSQSKYMTSHVYSEIPFPLRYLFACSNYEMKNTRDALSQLYAILRDLEKQKGQPSGLTKTEEKEDNEIKAQAKRIIKRESHELFGLFPPKEDIEAKIIMTTFEITRIHQRQQDYRNAYTTLSKLAKKYSHNSYVLARMGRLCLEAGRKQEAMDNFNLIHKLMKPKASSDNPLEQLTGTSSEDSDLEVLTLMNRGYVYIYDGNFKEAIETFRKILNFKPANILVANNCSTCQM